MRCTLFTIFFLLICSFVNGQGVNSTWYSETENNGIVIQNSFPKGGRYMGNTHRNYNHSYLVFFTRVMNETEDSVELRMNFSGDSIPIPNSPDTYVQLFLPPDTMTLNKRSLFSYGLTELASLEHPTQFKSTLAPKEDCLFYVVAVFYQTKAEAWKQERGGNRAELVLEGHNLFYRMLPQIDALPCGRISIHE